MSEEGAMNTVRSLCVAGSLLVVLVLSGCATIEFPRESEPDLLPERHFERGDIVYTMADTETEVIMADLEDLVERVYPESLKVPDLLREGGMQVPDEVIAGMYEAASGGDSHITLEEAMRYEERLKREIRRSYTDPIRNIRHYHR